MTPPAPPASSDPAVFRGGAGRVGTGADHAGAEANRVRPVAVALLLCWLGLWAMVGPVLWLGIVLIALVRFGPELVLAVARGANASEASEGLRRALGVYRRGFAMATDAIFPVEEDGVRWDDGGSSMLRVRGGPKIAR